MARQEADKKLDKKPDKKAQDEVPASMTGSRSSTNA
jgi:hypothetical protein